MIIPRPIILTAADRVRFWANVNCCGGDDCWEYLGWRDKDGYGRFTFAKRSAGAHRVAFVITKGETQQYVCHACNYPACCNPRHLYAGTQQANIRQAHSEGRVNFVGVQNNCAKLTEAKVRKIRVLCNAGTLQRSIVLKFGIDQSTVSLINTRKLWPHLV